MVITRLIFIFAALFYVSCTKQIQRLLANARDEDYYGNGIAKKM